MANSYDAMIKELVLKYRETQDEEIFNKIYSITERFIPDIVKNEINPKGYDRTILYKLGQLGLKDAIDTINFDNCSFIPYAKYCIREKINYFLQKHPTPSIQHDRERFIENIINKYHLDVTEDDYVTIRLIIEKLPSKVKKCILYKFGYFYNKRYSNMEIAKIMQVEVSKINNVFNAFKETLLENFRVKEIDDPKVLQLKNQGN